MTFIITYGSGKRKILKHRIPPRIHAHQHRRLGLAFFYLEIQANAEREMRIADVAFSVLKPKTTNPHVAFARTRLKVSTRMNLLGSVECTSTRDHYPSSQIFFSLIFSLQNSAKAWKNGMKFVLPHAPIYRVVKTSLLSALGFFLFVLQR